MQEQSLLFSIAINGYHWEYKKNIESHKAYASRYGYRYVVVDKPSISLLDMECAWLKIALIIEALRAEYDWVAFVDADAEIKANAPPIESLAETGKSIYMAKGYSGRINSGVMIAQKSEEAIQFFTQVLENYDLTLPEEDSVGWGENGHIIHFAKNNPNIKLISRRWNNNDDFFLPDYIRHYSAGPMRERYVPGLVNHLRFLLSHYYLAVIKRLSRESFSDVNFRRRLSALVKSSLRRYGEFTVAE